MSKGKVWNKGKHNGGVSKRQAPAINKDLEKNGDAELIDSNAGDTGNPIHSVKRMNRDNWVVRPARVVNKTNKEQPKS